MMSVHKLTSGDGYEYLTRQVAANDATNRGRDTLSDYYSEKGERPGQWIGSVAAEQGVTGEVTAPQMRALYGEGRHPDADRIGGDLVTAGATRKQALAATQLGRAFPDYSAASPYLQACAEAFRDHNLAAGDRWNAALPDDVRADIRTRLGRTMFAQEHGRAPATDQELHGYIARQSRPAQVACAGYDLTFTPPKSVSALWAIAPRPVSEAIEAAHHQAVADAMRWFEGNVAYTRAGSTGQRKLDVTGVWAAEFTHRDSRAGDPNLHSHVPVSNKVQGPDGKWRALDGTVVFKAAVATSERYNTLVEGKLRGLGLRFVDRQMGDGKRPVREVAGVDPRLCDAWSTRSQSIHVRQAELAVEFRARHGRTPTPIEAIALAQQANLDTRQGKHEPRSLAEQRQEWRAQAERILGGPAEVAGMVHTATACDISANNIPPDVTVLADRTLRGVAGSRAKWQVWHVRAEAERQVRAANLAPDVMDGTVEQVTALVLGEQSLPLTKPDPVDSPVPSALQARDRESVYVTAGAALYTSQAVVDAERRIIAAGGRVDGFAATGGDVDIALLEWSANHDGLMLNAGQEGMARAMAVSGQRVQLALAPAGTGKTTAMGVLASAWANGGGDCLAFSPTAAAAAELSAALGGAQGRTLASLEEQLGKPARWRQAWANNIGPQSLLIVDEAGMASTAQLDLTIRYALARGASVRLVGDERQLASIAAGGVLRDLQAVYGAVTLNEVVRFSDPAEGAASLALRTGDPSALGYYLDRGRVHAGDATTVMDQAFAAWSVAAVSGADAIMLAPTQDAVTALNARARAHWFNNRPGKAGLVNTDTPDMVTLADGLPAGVGDVVISRRNAYPLAVTATDFVKNGDRWNVTGVHRDGSLAVTRRGAHRVATVLPAAYVREHVRLGYATTVHSAQGVTADRCVAVVDETMNRNLLYVAMTRGRHGNHAFVQVTGDGDPHSIIRPEVRSPESAAEVLAAVLGREDQNVSATSALGASVDPARVLGDMADRYADAIVVAAETMMGGDRLDRLTERAEATLPTVTAAPAWDTLRAHLAVLTLDGQDAVGRMTQALGQREIASALDAAAVLDWRMDRTGNHSQQPGPLPWLPAVPSRFAIHESWGPYLAARGGQVQRLAAELRAQVDGWTPATAPAWARPYLADRALTADLAVWRAAFHVDPSDIRPTGPRSQRLAVKHQAAELDKRAVRVGGRYGEAGDRWEALLRDARNAARVTQDPYWPVLAQRLNTADAAGLPVLDLLRAALGEGPLPVEYGAEALWWRLAAHMAPTTGERPPTTAVARPPWTPTLAARLGEQRAAAVMADSVWPSLVSRVDQAVRDGWDAERLVSDAAGMLAPHTGRLAPAETATALLWQVSLLADPEPYHFAPPDPMDEAQEPPADAHLADPVVVTADLYDAETYHDTEPPTDDPDYDRVPDVEATPPGWEEAGFTHLPEEDLDPDARLDALERRLDAARARYAELTAQVHHRTPGGAIVDGGPVYRAALPHIQQLRQRADALAPYVADAAWAHQLYMDADRDVEVAAARLAEAQAAAAGGDPETVAELATAQVVHDGAASAAAELFDVWEAEEAKLADATGGEPVVTGQDVDAFRLTVLEMDVDALAEVRREVERLEGAVWRAGATVARTALPAPVGPPTAATSPARARSVRPRGPGSVQDRGPEK